MSGCLGAASDLGLLVFFKEVFGFHYLAAATLAFALAFFVSFFLQKFWTFGHSNMEAWKKQMALYLGVAVFNLGLNAVLMYIFVQGFNIWYFWAQILAGGSIALVSFTVYRRLIFKRPQQ